MSKECRICFENKGTMINPCLCSGSLKYVHEECIEVWRTTSKLNYIECPTCKYKYDSSEFSNFLLGFYRFVINYSNIIGIILFLLILELINSIMMKFFIIDIILQYKILLIPLFLALKTVVYIVSKNILFSYCFVIFILLFQTKNIAIYAFYYNIYLIFINIICRNHFNHSDTMTNILLKPFLAVYNGSYYFSLFVKDRILFINHLKISISKYKLK